MNLQKLLEAQQVLDEHIMNEHPVQENESRLEKKILALQVELGECANEWRGFKFWSTDQEPRMKVVIKEPQGQCADVIKYPLLEEYVDYLHFILSIGLEIKLSQKVSENIHEYNVKVYTETDTINQFQRLFYALSEFSILKDDEWYIEIFLYFAGLGTHLGFTWEEIEQAYFEKNQINHQRQEEGY